MEVNVYREWDRQARIETQKGVFCERRAICLMLFLNVLKKIK